MPILFNIDLILPKLERGALVLTPNKRLAAKIKQAYGDRMRQSGVLTWVPPLVMAEDTWISKCWMAAQDAGHDWAVPAIISNAQRRQLFLQIVKSSSDDIQMGVTQLASNADSAYRNLELWLKTSHDIPTYQMSSNKLKEWCLKFESRLNSLNVITAERSVFLLAEAFERGDIFKISEISLFGFDQIAPLFLKLCQAACSNLTSIDPAAQDSSVYRCSSRTPEDELIAAASWAKQILDNDPNASIGIIVPDLSRRKLAVERAFVETFEPTFLLPTQNRYALPFNFSVGSNLLDAPVINDAVELLSLHDDFWDVDTICAILRSPFWGCANNNTEIIVQIETALRDLAKPTIRAADLEYCASKVGVNNPVTNLMMRLNQLLLGAPTTMRPSQWSALFIKSLEVAGWPGQRRTDSIEYQQIVFWYEALESFSSLDLVSPSFGRAQALQHLKQILAGTIFQPKTSNGPIQILGALEGASLQFTHCRVLGMDRASWPNPPSPNPLLPIDFQRDHQMPRCDANRELELAVSITKSLSRSAPLVIFSHAETNEEGTSHASPLIIDFPVIAESHSLNLQYLSAHSAECKRLSRLDYISDAKGPCLLPGVAEGGSSILKEQAACPFNAFATFRLGAIPFQPAFPGLTPIDRGNLIHAVMAALWLKWKDQRTLLNLDVLSLKEDISSAVNSALRELFRFKSDALSPRFFKLEVQRLTDLAHRIVEVDAARPPFKIGRIEASEIIEVGPLTLKVRLDREDLLENEQGLLIDYKTGRSHAITNWQGDRPEDPQLPIYAISRKSRPSGIAFSVCNAIKTAYCGIGDGSFSIPGIAESSDFIADGSNPKPTGQNTWGEIIAHWEQALHGLANEYFEGVAEVRFSSNDALRHSYHLLPLNRYLDIESINAFNKRNDH